MFPFRANQDPFLFSSILRMLALSALHCSITVNKVSFSNRLLPQVNISGISGGMQSESKLVGIGTCGT
ncbi:Uncharacterised protein [Yersinia pseudotuberculosis]|nr:Uncharacterised protein [Yersinia pseudotuberculosis]